MSALRAQYGDATRLYWRRGKKRGWGERDQGLVNGFRKDRKSDGSSFITSQYSKYLANPAKITKILSESNKS